MKEKICKICNHQIIKSEHKFYFPHMPQWHELSDLSGSIFHIDCIKSIDKQREIGKQLAYIQQDMATKSYCNPLIERNGNIIIRAGLDEKTIEIVNYEDFVEFSIPIFNLEKIISLEPGETMFNKIYSTDGKTMHNGLPSFHVLENGNLELITDNIHAVVASISSTSIFVSLLL